MPAVNSETGTDRLFGVANTILLILVFAAYFYPLFFVVIASVSDPMMLADGRVWVWPAGFQLDGYRRVLTNADILVGYRNTALYTLAGVCVNLIMTVLAAYPLSRKELTGRTVVLLFLTFTMFFSGGLIPTYLVVSRLGLINRFWAMIIPNAVSVYLIIVMRTFFQNTIPEEIHEAAVIDGSSHVVTLTRIVLPLSRPVIAVMILFYGVAHWNSYFNALIYLVDRNRYTLQLFLREILVQNQMDTMKDLSEENVQSSFIAESIKYALIIVASVPVLLLYPFLQRYFVKGVMIGAIKG